LRTEAPLQSFNDERGFGAVNAVGRRRCPFQSAIPVRS
jgi:hypothetical protein